MSLERTSVQGGCGPSHVHGYRTPQNLAIIGRQGERRAVL
jgi:hypothetical protein